MASKPAAKKADKPAAKPAAPKEKPAEKKPAEKKPAEVKPADKKPEAKSAATPSGTTPAPADAEAQKKRTFRKFSYRGVDLEQLLNLPPEELVRLVHARARRRFTHRGVKRKNSALIKRLNKARKEAQIGEKPAVVRTHLRNMIIVPEMIGTMVGVHNGKAFNTVEIKPEMIGHYLGEFSITYKPVTHGRPGIGATHSSRFIPLK